jgi:lysozyme family protein
MIVPATFENCLAVVFEFDGLRDDRAPGESFATAYGVTEFTWAMAVRQGIVPDKDVSESTRDECVAVLRALFWNACHCSQLPPGINLMVFNDAVLTGVGHAVKLLQRVVGCRSIDGVVGPETIRRAGSTMPRQLIESMYAADEQYLSALKNAPLYLKGWMRREDRMRDMAYDMAGIAKKDPGS